MTHRGFVHSVLVAPAAMADKRRAPFDGLPFLASLSFIFSYEPNRTSEYDICRRKDADNPVYKLLIPVSEIVVRNTENMEGL